MIDGADAAERGNALLDLGRAVEAERYVRAALATDPTNADLLVSLAQSLLQQEQYDAAREAARQGLARFPEHLGGLIVLSAASAGLNDFPAALQAIRHGLQIAPGLAQFHAQEGALLIAEGRSADALGPLERARTLDPEDSGTVATISAALYNTRRFEAANNAATEALGLDPNNSEAHRIRGLLSLRRGGGRSAVDAHRAALRLDPTDPNYRAELATAMKSRNPIYGLLLRFGAWQEGLPSAARWAVLLAPLLASRLLRPVSDQMWGQILMVFVFALVLLSWALEPVMNTVLLCSSYSRNLLSRDSKMASYAFVVYVLISVSIVSAAIATTSQAGLVLGLGLVLWAVSAGHTHLVPTSRRRIALTLQGAGLVIAAWACASVALGALSQGVHPGGVLVLSGLAMLWFTALA